MTLDHVRPPKTGRVGYRLKHCPRLYLQVRSTGHKSWVVMLRVGGKQAKETLGAIEKIPTLAEAVAQAQRVKAKARVGREVSLTNRRVTDLIVTVSSRAFLYEMRNCLRMS
jgi:hypothetical protein